MEAFEKRDVFSSGKYANLILNFEERKVEIQTKGRGSKLKDQHDEYYDVNPVYPV